MKQQVARLSPHQNGKVFAVLMAVSSLVFVLPFALFGKLMTPSGAEFPVMLLLGLPILYLVFTYVSIAASCALYNFMVKFTGGIEFESRDAGGA